MPKERIYSLRRDGAPADPVIENDLSIQWDKAQAIREWDADGYEGHISIALVPVSEDIPRQLGYFDRTAINKLIEVLRRARNNAFGVDA